MDLWTFSKFLSRHPIKDAYAAIETPETSGLIPADTADQSGILEGASLTRRSSPQAGRQGFEDPEHLWEQPAPRGSNLGISINYEEAYAVAKQMDERDQIAANLTFPRQRTGYSSIKETIEAFRERSIQIHGTGDSALDRMFSNKQR
jgi:hypothetical protein